MVDTDDEFAWAWKFCCMPAMIGVALFVVLFIVRMVRWAFGS